MDYLAIYLISNRMIFSQISGIRLGNKIGSRIFGQLLVYSPGEGGGGVEIQFMRSSRAFFFLVSAVYCICTAMHIRNMYMVYTVQYCLCLYVVCVSGTCCCVQCVCVVVCIVFVLLKFGYLFVSSLIEDNGKPEESWCSNFVPRK